MTDAEVDALRDASCGDAEIAEIIGHVALSTFTNYFNKAMQTDVEFPEVGVLPLG